MIPYDINEIIYLRDNVKLPWKQIEEKISVSLETLRKAYKREKNRQQNIKTPYNYISQKYRGLSRKLEIIKERGGKCEICGYDKNIAALEFHHIDKENKLFNIDVRKFSNYTLETLRNELNKCMLLCSNCHREIHNPSLSINNIQNTLDEIYKIKTSNKSKINTEYGSICPVCNKRFYKATGKIYCSKKCRETALYNNYPSYDEITEQYNILKSWEKVANYYGLTRKIIRGIRSRHEKNISDK